MSYYHGFFDEVDWLSNCGTKRHGTDHVVLVREVTPVLVGRLVAWCRSRPGVVDVLPITETEFWRAPSNSV